MSFQRIMTAAAVLAAVSALVACTPLPTGPTGYPAQPPIPTVQVPVANPVRSAPPASARMAARNFITVLNRMEPAVERECMRRRTSAISCDYLFVVDDRPAMPPNAFQTVGDDGRPVVGFTLALIAQARNPDELAFAMGHEAAHHILGHIPQQGRAATAGAILMGGIAAATGGDAGAVRSAQNMGAQLGARVYSKNWELEADRLGAIIALNAGYDPVLGAEFFRRIPDPGNRILGSHPATAERMAAVTQAVQDVQSGRAR
ncbi:M48 family metalloprotease [Paracoccus pacificus]|uniref:M48 family metalloprotease n=1 Tax=Paracoccus pacificus TaxID=1463598 RepID=A0ABW4RBN6_9RHOB